MVDLEIASALTFFAIMGLLILKDRKNIEFNYGLIIKRWTRGKDLEKFCPLLETLELSLE